MMDRYYRFAGLEFQFSMDPELMYEKEYNLAPFSVPVVTTPHIFRFRKVDKLATPEGDCVWKNSGLQVYRGTDARIRYLGILEKQWSDAYFRVAHCGKKHEVQLRVDNYPDRVETRSVLESIDLQHLILQNQGFIFHCSYIHWNGKAILFTAPSETGKSTQADLWNKYRNAEIINGDRAAVRIVDGTIMAEGIPFSGSSNYCENRSLPIQAIVYLGQAPVTTIRKLRGYEAFSKIWEGISVNTWDREDMEKATDIVMQVAQTIPIYHMPCTPDEAAVEVLEQELRKLVTV